MTINTPRLSRRALLGTAALGAAAIGTAGLAACGPSGDSGDNGNNGNSGSGKLVPPTYVPFAGVTPDKPGDATGVSPVFYNYPNPPIEREGYPLTGGAPWRSFQQSLPTKVPPAENKAFQQMAELTGSSFEIIHGTSVQYLEKFQTLMASNDLPDFVQIVSVAQLPKLLEKNFTDLTDVLGGDNVKKYPGLANIPTETWKIPALNGKLWGIPQPRPPANIVITSRGDVMAERGLDDPNLKLRDGNDFVNLLKELTNKSKDEFAMGALPSTWLLRVVLQMVGAPNVWKEEGGTFTHMMESEQYKVALEQSAKIWQAGYLHPNSFSEPSNNAIWYRAGTTALYVQSFVGWGGNANSNPEWNVGNIEMPKWDGGGMANIHKSVAGYGAYVAIKKSEGARLEYLLKIADLIASPFGTKQFLQANYGVEGYNYNFVDGNPVTLPVDSNPGAVAMSYMGGNSGGILFGRGRKESVDAQQDYLKRALPNGIDDPTWGLYSETFTTKGATQAKAQADLEREIITGTKPISVWDDWVKSWRAAVGDASAKEYAEAKAAQ